METLPTRETNPGSQGESAEFQKTRLLSSTEHPIADKVQSSENFFDRIRRKESVNWALIKVGYLSGEMGLLVSAVVELQKKEDLSSIRKLISIA